MLQKSFAQSKLMLNRCSPAWALSNPMAVSALSAPRTFRPLSEPEGNSLFQLSAFGASRIRKKFGLYAFKLGKNKQYKNPHAMNMRSRMALKKQGYVGQLKIHERERLSDRPFGQFNRKGKFMFELEKVPLYNVPNLHDFKLKPYVPHSTPLIPEEQKVKRQIAIDKDLKA